MDERRKGIIGLCRPLLQSAKVHFSIKSNSMIREALRLAVRELSGLYRYDGTPFVVHSINTAMIVADEIGLGRNSVIATLLHDPSRLGKIDMQTVADQFGSEVTTILKGLNSISEVDPKVADDQADNFKELILSYSTDPRVILIKLADRLEVMRSLGSFPAEKREKIMGDAEPLCPDRPQTRLVRIQIGNGGSFA